MSYWKEWWADWSFWVTLGGMFVCIFALVSAWFIAEVEAVVDRDRGGQ